MVRRSALLLLLAGCVAGEVEGIPEAPVDESGEPRGIYLITMPEVEELSSDEVGLIEAAPPQRTLFVNFNGGTYTPGSNNSSTNRSSIPTQVSFVPAYEGTATARAQVLDCIRNRFAPFNIVVTDVDPGAAVHVEAVMGGNPQDVGMGSGVGGVAPMNGDCSVVERAVVYSFTKVLGTSPTVECEVAAQEIAHAYGLDHEMLCSDPMTYLAACGAKQFRDQAASCGEYSARTCMCGGTTQNSYQELLATLGPAGTTPPPPPPPMGDTTPPVVALSSPADGATVPANAPISIVGTASDDVGVTDVELIWQQPTTVTIKCSAPQSGVTCNRSGSTVTFSFTVGSGTRTFSMRAVDAAGNAATTPTRTITLGSAPPPPPTTSPPAVAMTSPAQNATVTRGSVIQIRASVSDSDGTVAQARLAWTSPGGTAYYTLSDLGGGTWGINLTLSSTAVAGARTLVVTATDDDGLSTSTAPRTIQVAP
jgi:hypothetical protein